MNIYLAKKVPYGDFTQLEAAVETHHGNSLPEKLWFKYPAAYQEAISERADAFISTLFLIGMHLKEDIEVFGDVSPLLAENIDRFQEIYIRFYGNRLSKINIKYHSLIPAPQTGQDIHLSSFSGGIDSQYTIWSHLHPQQTQHPVHLSHSLFIQGLDMLLQHRDSYQHLVDAYADSFKSWRIQLLQASTNAYSFYQFRLPWAYALTPTLAGTALGLQNRLNCFHVPGSYARYLENPETHHSYIYLLSTEATQVKVHADEIDRPEKLTRMANWLAMQGPLRVCLKMDNPPGVVACQRCRKCISTAMCAYLTDTQALFPLYGQFSIGRFIRFCLSNDELPRYLAPNYMRLFLQKKRFDLLFILVLMLPYHYLKWFLSNLLLPRLPNKWVRRVKAQFYPKQDLHT